MSQLLGIAFLLVLSASACSGCPRNRSKGTVSEPPGTAAPHQATPSTPALIESAAPSCAGRSLIGCSGQPVPAADVCAQLGACITQRERGERGEVLRASYCQRLIELEAPPPGAGLEGLAVLTVQFDADDGLAPNEEPLPYPLKGEASFLLSRGVEGYCVVDKVLDWDWDTSGNWNDRFDGQWSQSAQAIELSLSARHQSLLALDQDELKRGEPDLQYQLCRTLKYAVVAGKLTRVGVAADDTSCAKN